MASIWKKRTLHPDRAALSLACCTATGLTSQPSTESRRPVDRARCASLMATSPPPQATSRTRKDVCGAMDAKPRICSQNLRGPSDKPLMRARARSALWCSSRPRPGKSMISGSTRRRPRSRRAALVLARSSSPASVFALSTPHTTGSFEAASLCRCSGKYRRAQRLTGFSTYLGIGRSVYRVPPRLRP
jgi:hypothetical protein